MAIPKTNRSPTEEEIDKIYARRKSTKPDGGDGKSRIAMIKNGVCPECGAPLLKGKLSGGSMGVGQAYCQANMPAYEICYEITCSKCGLVIGKGSYHVNQ